jgi:hypothetical protein
MNGSTSRRMIAGAAAALVPLFVLAPFRADAAALSTGCTARNSGATITAGSGSITISGAFAAGEQVRFTATGSALSIKVTAPSGISTLTPTSGQPVRYDVLATSIHQFAITGTGSVSLTTACGIAPTITGTDNAQYSVNDVVSPDAACVAGTNAIDTCSVGTVDTSSAGARSYLVTATDTAGLQRTRTFHYTVAKKAQTIHFTSPPVTDAIVGYRYGYAVTAVSSSGLPVTLTTDPGSPVCGVSSEPPFIYGNVSAFHAGTCNVYANQAGNDEYQPAQQVGYSFEIARELTTLDAAKASKGVLGLSGTTFSANLHRRGWFGPGYGAMFAYPGETVKFYVGGKLICSAVTVQKDDGTFFGGGVATCKAPIGVQAALKYNSYTAVYAGSQDYLPSTAIGKLQ